MPVGSVSIVNPLLIQLLLLARATRTTAAAAGVLGVHAAL